MIYKIWFENRNELSFEVGHLGMEMHDGTQRCVCYTNFENELEFFPCDNIEDDFDEEDCNYIFDYLHDYFNGNLTEIEDRYVEVLNEDGGHFTKNQIEEIVKRVIEEQKKEGL